MDSRILFVDDDSNLLASFQRSFRKIFSFEVAQGGVEALETLRTKGPFAVIVSDMRMPGMDGLELLERCASEFPNAVRVMLTGNADQQTAVDAVNRGSVFRFVNKPCPPDDLIPVVNAALEQHKVWDAQRQVLQETTSGCAKVLCEVLGMVAPEALGRGQRLRESVHRFAEHLKIADSWEIEMGALLSPLGFASLPLGLLRKASFDGDLTPAEAAIVKRVPTIGYELISAIPRLQRVANIILYQNQNFDGTGYPGDGCGGDAIPIGSRLLKIISDRALLEADGVVKRAAFEAMRKCNGVYDPALLEKCFECFPTFLAYAISADKKVHSLSAAELHTGHVLVADLSNRNGVVLLSSGSRITAMMLERLRNYAAVGELNEPVLVQDSD